jgi:hypothetical protein
MLWFVHVSCMRDSIYHGIVHLHLHWRFWGESERAQARARRRIFTCSNKQACVNK